MAKISQLPALNDPDGSELVPVVKAGKTMRASVSGLVAGAVAGTVDNLKVDAVAYIGRPGDAALVDGTPTGIGAIYWHDTVDDAGSVFAVDVFDQAAGTINLAVYRGPRTALVRVAQTSFKTTGTRTSRRIALAEPIAVRAGDFLAVQPTDGALVVAEVQSGDVGYTYSSPYLPETIALDAPTTNGQVQVRFVIAYRKQVVTADTFLAATAAKIVGPRAVALSGDVNPRGYVEWATTGQPTGHLVKWGNYTATLDGKTQRMEFPNFSLAQPYAFIGNSLTDSTDVANRWSQVLGARYRQMMISVARYSSDWRMVYRVGAKAIVLTLAGALPAAGTVAVSKINGAPIDGNNPAAFLTTGDPNVVSGMAMSGYLARNGVTRRATVSAPNGASFAYVVAQAPGQTAITFDGPATFVPDFALSVPGRICVIWLGNNYFFSGVANTYGDYTNPQMWVDLKLIVAFLQARGCRVLLLPIIPSANTAAGDNWLARGAGTPYTAMDSANARNEALFPGLMARHADGRTLLKFLQDRNDGSPEALDDVAKGFTPRNLRRKADGSYDLLHMYGDGAGDLAVADFVDSALQAQALPNLVTQTTDFIITAIGADGQTSDPALVRVSRDAMADVADKLAGAIVDNAKDVRRLPAGGLAFGPLPYGTGYQWGFRGGNDSFLGLIANDGFFAPDQFRAPVASIKLAMLADEVADNLKPGAGSITTKLLAPEVTKRLPAVGYNFTPLPFGTGYKWGLQGNDGTFFPLMANDGMFAPEAMRLPAGAVTSASLAAEVGARLIAPGFTFSALPPGTGYKWGLRASDGSFFGLINLADQFSPDNFTLPDKTVTKAKLAADVASALVPSVTSFRALPAGMGINGAAVGTDGSLLYTIDGTGKFDMSVTRADAAATADLASGAMQGAAEGVLYNVWATQTDLAARQIWAQRTSDGLMFPVTKTGDNFNPRLDRTGKRVIFTTTNAGERLSQLDRDVGRAMFYPTVASADITGIGDSYTGGVTGSTSYLTLMAADSRLSGRTITNRGVGGDRGEHIAFRLGSVQGYVSVSGGSIPASGAVAVTLAGITVRMSSLSTIIRAPTGDVAGNLATTDGGATFTFTRASSGSAIAVPDGTEIVSTYADAARSTIRIISFGVNDTAERRTPAEKLAYLTGLMDDQRTIGKKTIVIGHWDSRWFSASAIADIPIVNALAQAACAKRGMSFLDVRGYVLANANAIMAANGITPTAIDASDIARGVIPQSLRPNADDTHVSTIVQQIWATSVADLIIAKGY